MRAYRTVFQLPHLSVAMGVFWAFFAVTAIILEVTAYGWKPENLLFWPLAHYFVSWAISFLLLNGYLALRMRHDWSLIIFAVLYLLVFGALVKVSAGIAIILLERLFDLPEHFTWATWSAHLLHTWPEAIRSVWEGALFFIGLISLDLRARWRRLQEQLNNTELQLASSRVQALGYQLHPHFLFNALNAVAMLVRRDRKEEAVDILAGVSDLLRQAMNKEQRPLISVAEEMELAQKYLRIEQRRFADRLTVSVEIEEDAKPYLVPTLLLQPLLENAFKHGIAQTLGPAQLQIRVWLENNRLCLSVFNSGAPLVHGFTPKNNTGIGLFNTVHRLRQLYASEFTFRISEENSGVLVVVFLPLKKATS